jgi:hypothetical protein
MQTPHNSNNYLFTKSNKNIKTPLYNLNPFIMRKHITLLFLALLSTTMSFAITINENINLYSTSGDCVTIESMIDEDLQNQIIDQCLSFDKLIENIPGDWYQNISEYVILNHGIDFNFPNDYTINEKGVSLINKTEINSSIPYFLFHTLNISENKVFVRYYFIYTDNMVEKSIPVTLEFERVNSAWVIKNYTI